MAVSDHNELRSGGGQLRKVRGTHIGVTTKQVGSQKYFGSDSSPSSAVVRPESNEPTYQAGHELPVESRQCVEFVIANEDPVAGLLQALFQHVERDGWVYSEITFGLEDRTKIGGHWS